MTNRLKKILKKTLKITGLTIVILLALMFLIPMFFSDTITEQVKKTANNNLDGKLSFKDSNLSFFKHFPSLTLTLDDFNLNGSTPFKNESLLKAKEVSLGINIFSFIFGNTTEIDEIYFDNSKINIQVNAKGEANYNVYKSKSKEKTTAEDESKIKLKRIVIQNSELVYNDKSTKIIIDIKGLNYNGRGDLENENFRLKTATQINAFSFTYDNKQYLKDKKVKADLITKINTNSLAFEFEKNNLLINKFPFEFSGFFNFISNGYTMDFKMKTADSDLEDLFSALPPEFGKWTKETKVQGKTDAMLTLKGNYIVSENKKPEVNFVIKVRDGYVKNIKAPYPVENLFIKLDTKLPNLDVNQLQVTLDSLFFNCNKNSLSAILKSTGLGNGMDIHTKIKSNVDLGFVDNALRIPSVDLKGKLNANIVANGKYDVTKKVLPVTTGNFQWENGSLKTDYYPNAIQNINLNATLNNPTGTFKDAQINIQKANFNFENKPFQLTAMMQNLDDVAYDIVAKGTLNIGRIYQVFKVDGVNVDGKVIADVALKGKQSDAMNGNYNKLNNSGILTVQQINTKTSLLPLPFSIENGVFTFHQNDLKFQDFKGKYGSSDIQMSGYFQNAINFFAFNKGVLKGKFNFNSNSLNTNEFFFTNNTKTTTATQTQTTNATTVNQVAEIPKNLDLEFNLDAKKFVYEDIIIKDMMGNVKLQNGKITLSNGNLNIIDAHATINGSYENIGTQKANFNMQLNAEEFDIKRAYNEIKLFRDLASSAKDAEGIIGIDYQLKGVLDNTMKPIMPSLDGNGTISVKNVKMNNYKLMSVVAEKTAHNDLKNPNVSEIKINSTIKNNIINIERFKAKVSAFRLRFEGQTSLDGKLNLKLRVGLPPLGIIGIPIKVSGTQEKPQIKLGKKSDDLEETIYNEESNSIETKPDSTKK